ncbi:hypothetical protein GCM10020000_82280 [Streptomyces olivoverticillatus]
MVQDSQGTESCHQHGSDSQYQVVAARRKSFEDRAWQIPAIVLAAQAVLLKAATERDSGHTVCITAGFLTAFLALMAANLLLRQRRNQLADYAWLLEFERVHDGWDIVHVRSRDRASRFGIETPLLARVPPYVVWVAGPALLGALGLVLSIHVIATNKGL